MGTEGHDQTETHRYTTHYPEHGPRDGDPMYRLFLAYKRKTKLQARCFVAVHIGPDFCAGGLELHHAHLEWAVGNEARWQAVQQDFADVHDEESLAVWVESEPNFRWLCAKHHRSKSSGVHSVSHADWEAGLYAPGFLD